MSKNKLKPCPFCGSKNLMQYGMKAAGHRNNDTARDSGVNGGRKMKLINADTLEEKLKRKRTNKCFATNKFEIMVHVHAVEDCLEIVRDMPTVDAEPVKHGRWIETNDDKKKRCSECDVIHLIAQYPHGNANYCPNCGAKMDLWEVKANEAN